MIVADFRPEDAAWIRANVWPKWMKRMDDEHRAAGHPGCFLFRMSPCQLFGEDGICGHCADGSNYGHARCATLSRIESPLPWNPRPEIVWKTSLHGGGPYSRLATVFSTCRGFLCRCECWRDAAHGPVPGMVTSPAGSEPAVAKPAPQNSPSSPAPKQTPLLASVVPGQLDLFAEVPA